jgi:hypothetical protein
MLTQDLLAVSRPNGQNGGELSQPVTSVAESL